MALSAVALLVSSPALAAGVSFVRATSQYRVADDRGRFHPLNLLDDDPATIWCEGARGDGENEGVEIVFKKKQRIDRVVINPTPMTGRVVSAVRISDGTRIVTVNVGTSPAAEVFNRPLEGTTFTISIAVVGPPSREAAVPSDTVCLADALLYQQKALFGGGAHKLRYEAKVDQLVGGWNGGALGAPEQRLVFSLDGTWEWKYTPLIGGKGKRLGGEYRFRGERLLMRAGEVGRWADVQYRFKRVKVDAGAMGSPLADYDLITVNAALGKDLAGDYNNARFE
jgi:hypothetical protein